MCRFVGVGGMKVPVPGLVVDAFDGFGGKKLIATRGGIVVVEPCFKMYENAFSVVFRGNDINALNMSDIEFFDNGEDSFFRNVIKNSRYTYTGFIHGNE